MAGGQALMTCFRPMNMHIAANPSEHCQDILAVMPIPVLVVDEGVRFADCP